MRRIATVTVAVALTSVLSGSCLAQEGMGGGRGVNTAAGVRSYNAKTVESISGEVVSVDKLPRQRGPSAGGIHVNVKTEKETIAAHLGPAWYLKQQGLTMQAGDRIEIRGSRITYRGHPAIIAAEVKKGSQSLKLREDDGRPLWRGLRPGS